MQPPSPEPRRDTPVASVITRQRENIRLFRNVIAAMHRVEIRPAAGDGDSLDGVVRPLGPPLPTIRVTGAALEFGQPCTYLSLLDPLRQDQAPLLHRSVTLSRR
jgi:hypothetical protein